MYHLVNNKVFLKQSYSYCADIVNRLVQNLKKYGIETQMSVVGSKSRNMITQNEKEDIDYRGDGGGSGALIYSEDNQIEADICFQAQQYPELSSH